MSCYRYKAGGIRLDSGDIAYLSCENRKFFQAIEKEFKVPDFGKMAITASNDLNEETLDFLNKQVKALHGNFRCLVSLKCRSALQMSAFNV